MPYPPLQSNWPLQCVHVPVYVCVCVWSGITNVRVLCMCVIVPVPLCVCVCVCVCEAMLRGRWECAQRVAVLVSVFEVGRV